MNDMRDMNNRNKANLILALVFIGFLVATGFRLLYRQSFAAGLLAFVAEAALVGGIADWFAVTALFRKPLGFGWHTAIIPRNREKIIEKVSDLVKDELISTEAIKNHLSALRLTEMLLDRISGMMDQSRLKQQVTGFLSEKAEALDPMELARNLESWIKEQLRKEGVSQEIRNILQDSISLGKHREWLSSLLDKALEVARKPSTREKIYKVLREQERHNEDRSNSTGSFFVKALLGIARSSRHTNLFSISSLLQRQLVEILEQIRNPEHPVYQKLTEKFASLVQRLDEDETLKNTIQSWKNGILERMDLMENLQTVLSTVVESQMNRNEAAQWISTQLDQYRERLVQDDLLKESLDELLKSMLQKIIRSEHYVIGEVARETLESFTNERLNLFVEEKAGSDLQWIRINGSIIGGIAGLFIYLFTRLVYSPYIIPWLHALTSSLME